MPRGNTRDKAPARSHSHQIHPGQPSGNAWEAHHGGPYEMEIAGTRLKYEDFANLDAGEVEEQLAERKRVLEEKKAAILARAERVMAEPEKAEDLAGWQKYLSGKIEDARIDGAKAREKMAGEMQEKAEEDAREERKRRKENEEYYEGRLKEMRQREVDSSAQDTAARLQAEKHGAERERDEARREHLDQRQRLVESHEQAMAKVKKEADKKLDELKTDESLLRGERNTYERKSNRLEDQHATLEQQCKQLRKERDEMENALKEAKAEMKSVQQKSNAQLVRQGQEHERDTKKRERETTRSDELHGRELAERQRRIDDLTRDVAFEQERVENEKSRHSQAIQRLSGENLQSSGDLHRRFMDVQKDRDDTWNRVRELEKSLKLAGENIGGVEEKAAAAGNRADDAERELDDARADIEQQAATIDELEGYIGRHEQTIAELEQQVEHEKDNVALADAASGGVWLGIMETKDREHENAVAKLEQDISDLQASRIRRGHRLAAKEITIKDAHERLAKLMEDCAELKVAEKSTDAKLKGVLEELEKVKQTLSDERAGAEDLLLATEELETRYDELAADMRSTLNLS